MGLFKNKGDSDTDGGVNGQITDEVGDQFNLIRKAYEDTENGEQPKAFIEKVGGVPGTYSIFNPFKIFRYSKFGQTQDNYLKDMHFDQKDSANTSSTAKSLFSAVVGKEQESPFGVFENNNKVIENPTASDIVNESRKSETALAPGPYAASDFLWCKYYGKVPNNRLLTLRRYPIPVEDDALISDEKAPLVPIAQGITWYGKDIDNDLNNIMGLNWGLNWKQLTSKVQDVSGNEISFEDVKAAYEKLSGTSISPAILDKLKALVFTGDGKTDILKLAGYDESIQKYIRESYGDSGPYWNRILGPVNVIDRTLIRNVGFQDQAPITLNFEYSLRSYNGVNAKIAFLDLLSNFLSLTYNNAPFWGGGIRYFSKTGVTFSGMPGEGKFFDGDVLGAAKEQASYLTQTAGANLGELIDMIKGLDGDINKLSEDQKAALRSDSKALDDRFRAGPLDKLLAPTVGKLVPKPLAMRAILDGRAIGEWHLQVGNPLNPMALIGNLCLDNVKLEFGEVLGIDDFPVELKFKVTLKHGRPRAKQDIESMFNLGKGAMGYSQLPQPSSASNSHGERNTIKANSAREDGESSSLTSKPAAGSSKVSDQDRSLQGGDNFDGIISEYSKRVRSMYGTQYGRVDGILADYFKEAKTKD